MNIMGFGCELFYTDTDSIPRFTSIDPRESIFVTDDTLEENLTAFIRVYPKEEATEGYNVAVYTDASINYYNLSLSMGQLSPAGEPQRHYFNDVPAILYPNNKERTGMFEGIIPLQDALNKLVSDELNDFESFVDAYLVLEGMQGTEQTDIDKMKFNRVLLLEGESKAYWLIKDVNNEHIRELKKSITGKIRELGCIPDMEDMGSFGTSGVALKFKLIPTEIQASKQERVLQRGIQRKLELLYNIFRINDPAIGDYTNVKTVFQRNFIMLADDKQKEMVIDLQLITAGLMTRERFLIKHEGLTPEDAQAELNKIPAFEDEGGI
jgi:SPP1 family phage portal protein